MFRIKSVVPALVLVMASGALAQNTGTSFCNVTNNSTGQPTTLAGSFGSGVGSDLHLEVTQGVPGELAYFLAGNEATSGVVISNGVLCLVGTGTAQVFRYNLAGSPSNSVGLFDGTGVFQNLAGTSQVGSGFDVPNTVPGNTPIIIMSGSTWHFQVWHRDSGVQSGDSNFSNGLSVTFGSGGGIVPIAGMAAIPAGSFDMGSNEANGAPYFNDYTTKPVHHVTISQPFWMGTHQVTQTEYQAVMGTNPSFFTGVNFPVESVTWHEARAYCAAVTAQEMAAGNLPAGYEYRLPTEAEREYASRAGTTTEFSTGPALLCSDGRFRNSFHSNTSCGVTSPTSVGSFAPNAFGLYDMHGNLWDWCLDTSALYTAGSVTDPLVTSGVGRVIRGGSWFNDSNLCRSASRGGLNPASSTADIGFRLVLGLIIVP